MNAATPEAHDAHDLEARVVHIPEASHWVHHDAPEKVATLLVEHFAQP